MSCRADRRAGGGRALGRVRGPGAGGAPRVGARALRAADRALDRVPDRRRRAASTWPYRLDPEITVFSVDTGRLPKETFELIEQLRDRYPGLELELLVAGRGPGAARIVGKHGPNLFTRSVENRLLCCQVRKVQPLTPHLAGARRLDHRACAATSGRPAPTSARSRSTTTTARSSSSTRSPSGPRTRSGTTSRENDVPTHPLYARGYTSIGCAPCTRAIAPGEATRAGRWWWETNAPKECGIHCAIETGGFEHELHALLGEDDAGAGACASRGEASARSRSPRRRPCSRSQATAGYRDQLAILIAADRGGRGRRPRARRRSRSCSSSGSRAGRIRALYGPGGEQAALRPTAGCRAARALAASAREVTQGAAARSRARSSSRSRSRPSARVRSRSSLAAGGIELTVRLDRQGARLASVGV